MSPSALSRCIQRLEEQLGQSLFLRDKRNVRLTRAGEIFRAHAQRQLDGHQLLLEQLSQESAAPTGDLRVACTVTACHSILPDLLGRCRDQYPGIHLQLTTADSARCLSQLRQRDVDVAVVPRPRQLAPSLRFAPLAPTALTFIASEAQADWLADPNPTAQQWSDVPMIMPGEGEERQRLDTWFAELGVQPNVYAEVNGNEAIIAMASLGCGVGLVPELVLLGSPLRDAIRVVTVSCPPPGYDVGLCCEERTLRRRAVKAFWDLAA